jgi:protein-S-isoprenylcysteine O-methyltransferase Ste14
MDNTRRGFGLLANYVATMAVILVGLFFYTRGSSFHSIELDVNIAFRLVGRDRVVNTTDALIWLSAIYAILLIPYYALRPGFVCDARKIFSYAYACAATTTAQPNFGLDERRAALTLALKLFFVPLMVGFLLVNTREVTQLWQAVASEGLAPPWYFLQMNTRFYFIILALLFAIDTFIFTIGYMIEIPALNNDIKSVDPTALGWLSCLICYPPFNQAGFGFFGWPRVEFTDFGTPVIQLVLAYLSIVAVAIFAWASIALGPRASNLTNRGIVGYGPYRWVRHPAYVTKTLSAWIVALPAIMDAFSKSVLSGLWVVICLVAWALIYVVRAATEERHLLMIDNGYAEYKNRVRYRFIPGLV